MLSLQYAVTLIPLTLENAASQTAFVMAQLFHICLPRRADKNLAVFVNEQVELSVVNEKKAAVDALSFRKTPLASENFVDVFSMLSRWQLDPVDLSCRHFRYIVSTKMDAVCIRKFDSIHLTNPFDKETIRVTWQFTEDGEQEPLSLCFGKMEQAIEQTTRRVLSSYVGCFEFRHLDFADEMLMVTSYIF